MTEQPNPETIANLGITKEPGYLYFLDKDGNVKRIKKTGKRVKKSSLKTKAFKMFGTKVPKILLDSYISLDFEKVRGYKGYAGCIVVPRKFVDKSFRVILIPEHYYTDDFKKKETKDDRLQETG